MRKYIYIFGALVCLLVFAFPVSTHAQGGAVNSVTFSPTGSPRAGVTVTVCAQNATVTNGVCAPAENDANCCFTDSTLSVYLTPPPSGGTLLSSGLGNYTFWASPGLYHVSYSGRGVFPSDQLVPVPSVPPTLFIGAPTGSCLTIQQAIDTTTGNFYGCIAGAWIKIGPGGNPGVLVSPVVTPNPLNLDVNVGFKGPNPYVDGTRFGMRAVNQNAAPAVPGITANCTSGSPNVTISSASTFQNGDGVALYGCGPGTVAAPSAPTVTPSVLAAQTGLLLDVNGPTGATTYCYQLVARTLMGATNVSPETCTSTGPASLGLQTNTITSVSLANNVATYTTSAPHGLVQYAHVVITGVTTTATTISTSTPVPFNGWFVVATVADNTHFTVNLLTDSRNGAITVGAGGTVNYWNSIQIKATETTNNYIYYVYGRVTGGTKTLIGAMLPQDTSLFSRLTDPTYLVFDDLGSPVTTFPNPPNYIPATVPTLATNDMLATTIVSGTGTTSLVLAGNAGHTISGQTILFDDAVTFILAAKAACNLGAGTAGALMIPSVGSGLPFIFNSPISIGTGATLGLVVLQKGVVWLNEPITTSNISWSGQPGNSNVSASFTPEILPALYTSRASPGFFVASNTYFSNLFVGIVSQSGGGVPNGQLSFLQEFGGVPWAGAFRDISHSTGTGGPTYSNMFGVFRGAGYAGWDFTNVTIVGNQNSTLVGTTPAMYFNLSQNQVFKNLTLGGVGAAAIRPYPAGGWIVADAVYSQGGYMPYFSFVRHPTLDPIAPVVVSVRQVGFDTTILPFIANYGGHNLTLDSVNAWEGIPITGSLAGFNGSTSIISGAAASTSANMGTALINQVYFVNDGTFGRTTFATDVLYKNMAIGPGNSLFTLTGPNAAPTCPVSAGGSVPVGTFQYYYVPIYANGSEGTWSTSCIATTTSGNQTVTLSWSVMTGVTQYNLYRGLFPGNVNGLNCSPSTGVTYTDTAASSCGPNPTQIAAGGPAGMRGGLIWANTAQLGATTTSTLASTAVTASSVAVGGDTAFSASPRGTFTAFFPGPLTSTWTAATWVTTKPITITQIRTQAKTAPVGCSPNAVIRFGDGATNVDTTVDALADGGAIGTSWGAPNTLTVKVQTAAAGCGTSPADVTFFMEYKTQ